jgi:hypothetical protein
MKEGQALDKEVCWLSVFQITIPPSCFPVCRKISCVGVTLYTCNFKSFVDIRADALTLYFEESAGTDIFWGLLPVKQQYH